MNDKEERLQGRVATIINARKLAINIGRVQGVEQGMKFAVLAQTPLDIVDPETHRSLGVIDREKVRVKVSEVYEKWALCKTYRVMKIPGWDPRAVLDALAGAMQPPREVEEILLIDDHSAPPPLSEEDSYVKISDRVIQVDDE